MVTSAVGPAELAPSRVQVALAIVILKSKPKDLTVREYIEHLRDHLRRGHLPIQNTDPLRYLDSVAYWRDESLRYEDRCHELESTVTDLRRANDELRVRIDTKSGDDAASAKRKRASTKQTKSKRARASQVDSDQTTLVTQGTLAGDLDVLDRLGQAGSRLTQRLYTTHCFLKNQESNHGAVCRSLVEIARAIGAVISATSKFDSHTTPESKRGITLLQKDTSELSSVVIACARAFTSLLVGLGKIADNDKEHRHASQVVFECVRLFKNVLESMGEAAFVTAQARVASQTKVSSSNTSSAARLPNMQSLGRIRTLAQFLNAIISYLDKSDAHHREMFEGFLFILIERVSKKLVYCCRGRDTVKNIAEEIALPPDMRDGPTTSRQKAETLAVGLEVPALVIILERAIALAPYHMNSRPVSASSASSRTSKPATLARSLTSKTLPAASRIPLSTHAKERLQRTLIDCMFAEQVDDDFADVLRMPARLGSLPNMRQVDEHKVDEWFTGEIWRLVGTDLLESQVAW
ncbi:hypothetical protein EJ04DRAFT_543860 [Polyplosphaeria fusca]|uniref:Uncharacterized protein n=1 Tax=Polyplosphaeria fusca TaxID=682080 RepID=A0A9P4QWF3_9PLEO|nr:hypothetical protein EJ04DRAFT_543860 [Polyplosphaeria fusca]